MKYLFGRSCKLRIISKIKSAKLNLRYKQQTRNNSIEVYRSCSTNPYDNLAFEDWIHENMNLKDKRILFLWRNSPTVVIGRHQNPWKECNLELIKNSGINLVRRKSGGGAVYHDLGNVNCTFFSDRIAYNRRTNLEFIAKFLREFYSLKVAVNGRDDLVLDECYKISGTAAKLSLKKAYHHCTLLCQVDLSKLRASLKSDSSGINSNATASVASKTKNLFDENNQYLWENFTDNMGNYFFEHFGPQNDCKGIVDINPLDGNYSEMVMKTRNQLTDWCWNFGKTPKFHFEIEKKFPFSYIKLDMIINKGMIEQIMFDVSNENLKDSISFYLNTFIGQRFQRNDILATCIYHVAPNANTSLHNQISDWILSYLH